MQLSSLLGVNPSAISSAKKDVAEKFAAPGFLSGGNAPAAGAQITGATGLQKATATHLAAQETGDVEEGTPVKTSAADEFRAFMKKTPEERMIDQIVKSLGVSPEEFDAMSAEEQATLMNKVKELIEEKIRQATGIEGSGAGAVA